MNLTFKSALLLSQKKRKYKFDSIQLDIYIDNFFFYYSRVIRYDMCSFNYAKKPCDIN